MKKLLPLLIIVSFGACDVVGVTSYCTREMRAGIAVTVLDSLSNGLITDADSIMIVATDGAFSDTVSYDLSLSQREAPIGLAHERAGRYTVAVTADGYEPWSTEVRVTEDECHVITQPLTARLRRTPS